jgi:endoglucanase
LLPKKVVDDAKAATLRLADEMVWGNRNSGFRLSKGAWIPFAWGSATGASSGVACLRAYTLSPKREYLESVVRSIDYVSGANPANLCYTTGLGTNTVKHILHCDARTTGQPDPSGITVFGPYDPALGDLPEGESWVRYVYPDAKTWPTHEMYIDGFRPAAMAEYTVNQPMGTINYVWGWLAGRK